MSFYLIRVALARFNAVGIDSALSKESAVGFFSDFIDAIQSGKGKDFNRKFEKLDCLIIDDFQQIMNKEKQQSIAASEFAKRWMGRGYEKGDSQIFWADLLTNVYGVKNIAEFIFYEEQVKVDKTNFIDGHIPSTKVLIEQKSLGKDLRKGIVQSDGSILNPFQQAKRYAAELPYSKRPRWIITCNFAEFRQPY